MPVSCPPPSSLLWFPVANGSYEAMKLAIYYVRDNILSAGDYHGMAEVSCMALKGFAPQC